MKKCKLFLSAVAVVVAMGFYSSQSPKTNVEEVGLGLMAYGYYEINSVGKAAALGVGGTACGYAAIECFKAAGVSASTGVGLTAAVVFGL